MNRIWGLIGNEFDERLEKEKRYNNKNFAIHADNIIYRNKVNISREELKNELKDKIKNINKENIVNIYSSISLWKFNYALLYNFYGYRKEYENLLREIEYTVLGSTYEESMERRPYCYIYNRIRLRAAIRKLHCIIVLGEEKFKTFITRDRNIYSKNGENVRLNFEESTVYEYIYTLMWAFNKDEYNNIIYKNSILMYYSLYLYLTEKDNKEEYKKLTLNYAQKVIEDEDIYILDEYLRFVDLRINFPEVFGDFLDKPHKIIKAKEELLSFTKVNPIKELGDNEKNLIKKIKKDDIRIFHNKPKKINKFKEFSRNLIVTRYNSKITIENLEKNIENISLKEDYKKYYDNFKEIQQCYINMLDEIKNKFYLDYELRNENFRENIVKFEENIFEFKNIIIKGEKDEDNELRFIELGYKFFDLALMYSFINNEEKAIRYFKESTVYLSGEIREGYFEEPRDYDGRCESFIKNAYANIRINRLDNITAALYINPEIDHVEDEDELLEFELTEPEVLAVYKNVSIEELFKSVKDMIKMDEAYGNYMLIYKRIYESLKNIVEYKKTNNFKKVEITERKLKLLYNQIGTVYDYLDIYPIYTDLNKFLNK